MPADETALIRRLQQILGPSLTGHADLIAPVFGDDAALIRQPDGRTLVITQDLLVEGIDFRRDWGTLADAGYKAAVASLSDLAAKGATPRWGFCSVACPRATAESDLDAIYTGFRDAFSKTGLILAGGDLSASPGPVMIDLLLIGDAPTDPSWLRSNAHPGDVLWLGGRVGRARLGLLAYQMGYAGQDVAGMEIMTRAYLRPNAQSYLAWQLRRKDFRGACMDVSDGLLRDIPRLAAASNVGIILDTSMLAFDADYKSVATALGQDPLENALFGGEDFVLLGTCDPADWERFMSELPLIPIGVCTEDLTLHLKRADDLQPWPTGGFDHFGGGECA